MNLEVVNIVLAVLALILAAYAISSISKLRQELRDKYWTKDVIGRTINAKTDNDVVSDLKEQQKAMPLNETEEPEPVPKPKKDVKEKEVFLVREFCRLLEENIDGDPIPANDPKMMQLGFSYEKDAQNHCVLLNVTAAKYQLDDWPEVVNKFKGRADEKMQELIDHYKTVKV